MKSLKKKTQLFPLLYWSISVNALLLLLLSDAAYNQTPWFHRALLCNVACPILFCSILHMDLYPLGECFRSRASCLPNSVDLLRLCLSCPFLCFQHGQVGHVAKWSCYSGNWPDSPWHSCCWLCAWLHLPGAAWHSSFPKQTKHVFFMAGGKKKQKQKKNREQILGHERDTPGVNFAPLSSNSVRYAYAWIHLWSSKHKW